MTFRSGFVTPAVTVVPASPETMAALAVTISAATGITAAGQAAHPRMSHLARRGCHT